MTIEEKAKAYDEAIEVAREYWNSPRTCIDINVLPKLFPELKESEDEKIRKEILEHIQLCTESIPDRDKFIAWLEKQGEQILANSAKTCKDEQKPAEEYNITGIGSKHAQGKLGEMIKNLKPVNEVLEQNPAWSEEDENHIQHISDFIMRNRVGDTDAIYRLEQDVKWLKSLKDRYTWKPSDLQIKALEYYTKGGFVDKEGIFGSELVKLLEELKKL